jgi:GAF domain-containing protein
MKTVDTPKPKTAVPLSVPGKRLSHLRQAQMGSELSNMLRNAKTFGEACKMAVDFLHDSMDAYDWTGIYMVNGDFLDVLYYRGEPTPHSRIKIGEGVCSLAVEREKTVIVPDVSKEPVYLACSGKTKSEIVVPLILKGRVIGEIDIDSHALDSFSENDRLLLEKTAYLLSRLYQG